MVVYRSRSVVLLLMLVLIFRKKKKPVVQVVQPPADPYKEAMDRVGEIAAEKNRKQSNIIQG